MDNILQRTNKITVIAVAHRLSTLERCTTRVEFRSNSEPVGRLRYCRRSNLAGVVLRFFQA